VSTFQRIVGGERVTFTRVPVPVGGSVTVALDGADSKHPVADSVMWSDLPLNRLTDKTAVVPVTHPLTPSARRHTASPLLFTLDGRAISPVRRLSQPSPEADGCYIVPAVDQWQSRSLQTLRGSR
jgi:hypothetical protein